MPPASDRGDRELDRPTPANDPATGRHHVDDPEAAPVLLDWLAAVPAARKNPHRLRTYLYAPDPGKLVTQLAYQASRTDLAWALTGTAAARVYGATTVTAIPVITVRIGPERDLHDAAKLLGLERVDSGHNVFLLPDTGHVGIHDATRNGPVHLAPAVRVWLDMLTEPRGEDAAAQFREVVLGY